MAKLINNYLEDWLSKYILVANMDYMPLLGGQESRTGCVDFLIFRCEGANDT
ncbi:MAG: hypothetical protein HND59_09470 [Pseudomonadota bacterium]|nr:MAG: hypothetical protein HND59_09470 [Pseudomonadota bacterium]